VRLEKALPFQRKKTAEESPEGLNPGVRYERMAKFSMVLSIPPKYSVAMVIGYLKGKSAIQIHREMLGVKKGFTGKSFWSRGSCVSMVRLDEKTAREYVKNQHEYDKRQDELDFD